MRLRRLTGRGVGPSHDLVQRRINVYAEFSFFSLPAMLLYDQDMQSLPANDATISTT